jgi:glutamine cyclotransferase
VRPYFCYRKLVTATSLRIVGLTLTLLYAAAILRVYVQRPASLPEMSASLTSVVRAYQIDRQRFDQGLRFFRGNQFAEARDAFAQADPGRQDATVQFYVAYSYLRQGWGRVYSDDVLFTAGRAALDRARQVAPNGTIAVDDPDLKLHTAEELAAEFDRGLTRDLSDLNPVRLFRERP